MGVHIAHDRDNDVAILYCSTTDWGFGPVFTNREDHDADERAEAFLRWLRTTDRWYTFENPAPLGHRDPRSLTDQGLQRAYSEWLAQEEEQWAREEAAEAAQYAEDEP